MALSNLSYLRFAAAMLRWGTASFRNISFQCVTTGHY